MVSLTIQPCAMFEHQLHDFNMAASRRGVERRRTEVVDEVAVGAVLNELTSSIETSVLARNEQRTVSFYGLHVDIGTDDTQRVDSRLVVELGAKVKRRPTALVLQQ